MSCHGANLQGVPDRGPSLIGVGEAAVYFQVSSGRMPAMRGEAQAARKDPIFDESQIDALGAYVQANGGGPTVTRNPDGSLAMKSLRGDDLGRGGDLFRLNCSSCHNFTGKGGALSSGKFAPDLEPPTSSRSSTAMLTGPQNMPKFSDRQLSFDAKKDIIAYVKDRHRGACSPGGNGLGGFGPAPEGMVMWIIGMVAVIGRHCGLGRDHERRRKDTGPSRRARRRGAGRHVAARNWWTLGGKIDGVETVFKEPRWPVEGTKAEKRAERGVALWLLLGGGFGLALLLVFLFWPWEYKPQEADGQPAVLAGHPAVRPDLRDVHPVHRHRRHALPEKVYPRRDFDPGPPRRRFREIDRKTVVANLTDAFEGSTIRRRKLVGAVARRGPGRVRARHPGGVCRRPHQEPVEARGADRRRQEGRAVDLGLDPALSRRNHLPRAGHRRHEGAPFIKMRPEDIDAGGMETVFPWRESDGDGTTAESHEKLRRSRRASAIPVMLIRIKPSDMPRMVKRKGQESFNFGELFAYTKVCSHLGCPASLYEQQSYRILCPCHQSQFDALHYAKPIFGPAARALAQLPITIDSNGYLVANGDFIEPVGPAFWERTQHESETESARRSATSWPGKARTSTRAITPRRRSAASSTRSSRRTGRSCSARSRCTASSCCC